MQIEQLALDTVVPYWRNPRKNDSAVAAVKQSIEEFGFNSPLVLDRENVIIVGHTRYRALRELGWESAPCVKLDLDPAKAKAYRIADNKTAELAEWDMDKLIPELRELENIASMEIYFPDIDLDNLLADTAGVVNFSDVTQDQVDKAAASADGKFDKVSEEREDAQIEVLCPHCTESFFVTRADILGRMQ